MVPVMWGVDPLPARPKPVTGLQAQAIERSLCSAIDSGARVVITNYPAIDATARDGCS
jgi:hypothetical protein